MHSAQAELTDIKDKINEIRVAYKNFMSAYRIPEDHKIVVNYSGGKDSTVALAVAYALFGDRVQGVMADTDNEHKLTIDYGRTIHQQIGCAPIHVVKQTRNSDDFARRRAYVERNWIKRQTIRMGIYRGVKMPSLSRTDTKFYKAWRRTAERWGVEFKTPMEAALFALSGPSGNAFLDVALLHGKFPMMRDRFCTDELKIQAAFDGAIKPMLDDGEVVVQWSGVRADESSKRAGYERFSPDLRDPEFLYNFLPIHQWTAKDVFALHKHFGIKPNPLYMQGAARVGCMNCVLCNKEEIAETAARWPEHINKHREWEKTVRLVSRWVHWMSVGEVSQRWMASVLGVREITNRHGKKVKVKNNLGKELRLQGLTPEVQHIDWSSFYGPRGNLNSPGVDEVLEWAKTGKGGAGV